MHDLRPVAGGLSLDFEGMQLPGHETAATEPDVDVVVEPVDEPQALASACRDRAD